MSPQYAHLLDRTVRYHEAGSGRVYILLHAFPLSADQWLPQLHRVPPGWRLIAPDVRGFRGVGQAYQDVGLEGVKCLRRELQPIPAAGYRWLAAAGI